MLVDLSDGELAEEHRDKVTAHVAECASCRAELARLDQSLARLVNGVAYTEGRGSRRAADLPIRLSSAVASPSRRLTRQVAAAAAISLVCLLAAIFFVWHSNRPSPSPTVAHAPKTIPQAPAPQAPLISEADVLRRIALLEQQARLQTSLDLMPQAAWYDEQRADNQRLLNGFKAATGVAVPTTNTTQPSGETL